MKPDGQNVAVTVKGIYDEEGNSMESAPHAQQTMFRGAEVGMPLVHIAQVPGMDQCTWVQVSLLPRNAIRLSLVRPSSRHSLLSGNIGAFAVCLHKS